MDIKELRTKAKINAQTLAGMVGVSVATVSRWENGKSKPSPLAEKQLERIFKVKRLL